MQTNTAIHRASQRELQALLPRAGEEGSVIGLLSGASGVFGVACRPWCASLIRELSKAALKLAQALKEDEDALHELDEWSRERELLPRVVELPLALVSVGELDSALQLESNLEQFPDSCLTAIKSGAALVDASARIAAVTARYASDPVPFSSALVTKSGAFRET